MGRGMMISRPYFRPNPREALPLPNLLVAIDLREGEPTGPSLFALSEGRRAARTAGATVFALVFTDSALPDGVPARLGRAGADKVLLCEGPGLSAPPLDATHGAALYAAVERIPPLLVLFSAGGAGPELGPGLAARLGGAFAAAADLEIGEALVPLADGVGRVFMRRFCRDRTAYRRLDPVELERPVVAVLPAGGPIADMGTAEVEIEVIACTPPAKIGVVEVASEPDDQAAVALATTLVVVDPALGADAMAVLRDAARPGLAVVHAGAAPAGLANAAPRIIVAVGACDPGVSGTPRTRVAQVLPPGAAPPSKNAADVVWPLPADAGAAFLTELAADLPALARKDPPS